MKRRQFIKAGLLGGSALVGARVLYGPFTGNTNSLQTLPSGRKYLSDDDTVMFLALAPVILKGALSENVSQQKQELDRWVLQLDQALQSLSISLQNEVRELLALLHFPITRRWLAGVKPSWEEASSAEVHSFLEGWQTHRFVLLRSAYQALRELSMAAWYAAPETWDSIGYPGPPPIFG